MREGREDRASIFSVKQLSGPAPTAIRNSAPGAELRIPDHQMLTGTAECYPRGVAGEFVSPTS